MFLVVQSILYIGGNSYIFTRAWQAMSGWPSWLKIGITVVYWLCVICFFSVFRLRDMRIPATFAHVLHTIGTGWLVFTLYMVFALLITELLRLFHWYSPNCFFIALGVTLSILTYGYINYKNPRTVIVDLHMDKPVGGTQKELKAVAVSDLHLGYGTDKHALRSYIRKINALHPDLILIGGDLIDNNLVSLYEQNMQDEIRHLKAPLGIYMVPGNHEYYSGIHESEDFIAQTPIRLLKDSVAVLPNGLQIVGRDDRHNRSRASVSDLMNRVNTAHPVIILDHQPFELEKPAMTGADLQFSGHTHQGQIFPINLYVKSLFEISHGMIEKENTHIYVSSGLSLWGPPFRIGTTSEMVVFNLTFKE